MPILPTVQRNEINVSGGQVNVTPEVSQGGLSGGLAQAAGFANKVAQDYFIDEKIKFDRVRLIEAQNVMEAHKSRLQIDENDGYQNKLGEQAFLYKDEDGLDLVTSYSRRYEQAAQDTITQLQLTPDQQAAFKQIAARDQANWTDGLRKHQVQQGFKYKESVLSNTVELASRKAMGSYQDIEALEENLTTINASVSELGRQFGWSQAEVTNKLAEQYASVHNANIQQILTGDEPDFELAESYLDRYASQIPELNRHAFESKIRDLKNDYAAQKLINNIKMGVYEGSNPAFNTSDPAVLEQVAGTSYDSSGLPTTSNKGQYANIRFDDPRLDAKNELIGRTLGMDWAKPILTAIRVAGERSNNNQVSSANAKGVMQFTPIAIEQVRRITGKTIDPNDPDQAIWAAYKFVDWISKKYDTKDPNVIASYYNGGGKYINQMKVGGAKAITNTENRNYVQRIDSFLNGGGYGKYINRSMIGDSLNPALIASLPPKEQSKVIAAHQAALKEKEQMKKQKSEEFFNTVADAIENGGITSLRQLDREGMALLNVSQQKSLEGILKAKNLGEYNNDLYLDMLTNSAALKGMSQAEFRSKLMMIPPDAREEMAKTYARVNGRSAQDAIDVEKAERKAKEKAGPPRTSIVDRENVARILTRNAVAIGFNSGRTGTSKKANQSTQRGSAFWVAAINDITDRVKDVERRKGVNLTQGDIDRVVTSYLENSYIRRDGVNEAPVYDPRTFKRSKVPQYVNNYILRKHPRFKDIDDVPDNVFMPEYFRFYRGIR